MLNRAPLIFFMCSLAVACGDDEGTSSLSAASQSSNSNSASASNSASNTDASASSSSSSSDASGSEGSSGGSGSETTEATTAADSSSSDPTTDPTGDPTTSTSGTTTGGGDLCGNGLVDPGEQCDGGNLGAFTCTSLGYDGGGTLSCDPVMCTLDTSMCVGGGGSTSG